MGGEVVSGMTEIVKMHRWQTGLLERREPHPAAEVTAPKRCAPSAYEDQAIVIRLGEAR
jgi:hypothetical protein